MKIIRITFGQYIHVDTVNLANFQIANCILKVKNKINLVLIYILYINIE